MKEDKKKSRAIASSFAQASASVADFAEQSESAQSSIGGDATTFNWGAIPGDLYALNIPGFASGTNFAPGGLALVGENGPELVNLPRGSSVLDAGGYKSPWQQYQRI